MKHRIPAILFLILVTCTGSIRAHYSTPPQSNFPWNGLAVDRVPASNYVSIINNPTAIHLLHTGENIASHDLQFPIFFSRFLLEGSKIFISASGYISFNDVPVDDNLGRPYYLRPLAGSPSQAYQSKLLMPFWGDFIPKQPEPEGGVWINYAPTGTVYPPSWQALTIEWYVQEPTGPWSGKFQARFLGYNSDVFLSYDANQSTPPLPQPLSTASQATNVYGAVVGLKNLGQGLNPPRQGDDQLLVAILAPERNLESGHIMPTNPIAITRLGVLAMTQPPLLPSPPMGSGLLPEWYANYFVFSTFSPPYNVAQLSPFHFNLPTVSYRIHPQNGTAPPLAWPDEHGNRLSVGGVVKDSIIWTPDPVEWCSK